jgi:hypothetical protein
MGWNTSMIIMNDCLDQIKKDPEFGRKVAEKVSALQVERHICLRQGRKFYGLDVSAGHCVNAATVIETHHADQTSLIAFSGNMGEVIAESLWPYGEEELDVRVLKALASKLGYTVSKK